MELLNKVIGKVQDVRIVEGPASLGKIVVERLDANWKQGYDSIAKFAKDWEFPDKV